MAFGVRFCVLYLVLHLLFYLVYLSFLFFLPSSMCACANSVVVVHEKSYATSISSFLLFFSFSFVLLLSFGFLSLPPLRFDADIKALFF